VARCYCPDVPGRYSFDADFPSARRGSVQVPIGFFEDKQRGPELSSDAEKKGLPPSGKSDV